MTKSKSQLVYEVLRHQMIKGELLPGQRLPTEKQLAAHFKVSLLPVREALQRLRQEGRIISRRYHGTMVTAPSQATSRLKQRTIGLIVPRQLNYLGHPVFSRLVDGIEGLLAEHGYSLEIVASNPEDAIAEGNLHRHMTQSSALGWLVPVPLSKESKSLLKARGKPIVLLHHFDELLGAHFFDIDYTSVAVTTLAHLKEQGYRSISVIAPPVMSRWLDSFLQAGATNLNFEELTLSKGVSDGFGIPAGKEAAAHAIALAPVDAFICADDELAAGALQHLNELGVEPPQIGLVGGGDFPLGSFMKPPLTTLSYPYFQIGREAAQLLIQLIAQKTSEPAHRRFVPRLIIRESSLLSMLSKQ